MDHDVLVEKVDRLITQMGLAHIRDQIIGDEKTRGISGGQRKACQYSHGIDNLSSFALFG